MDSVCALVGLTRTTEPGCRIIGTPQGILQGRGTERAEGKNNTIDTANQSQKKPEQTKIPILLETNHN